MRQNNKKDNNDALTIKEASGKLDISESTVKKYLKDFELTLQSGTGSKAQISLDTFQALSEIVKLRENGLSINEIKELKSQKPSKNILDEIDETKEEETKSEEKPAEDDLEKEEITSEKEEDIENTNGKDDEEEEESTEIEPHTSSKETQGTSGEYVSRRKRLFNYRYVERQIANDSRRVGSLRQRLKITSLSVQERLFIEEALERRILFLDGWKHILRWTSK